MNAIGRPGELHLQGCDQDLLSTAASFMADVVPVGRRGRRMSLQTDWVTGYAVSLGMHHGLQMMAQDLVGHIPLILPISHGPSALEVSSRKLVSPGIRRSKA